MPVFTRLDDTPMFRKRLYQLEEASETLRDRSNKLLKGCKKYADSLSDAATGELNFAKAVEAFGNAGGPDDPISIAVGGPVMGRFVDALRELRGYKEVLKSQVEHMLLNRISKFKDSELQNLRVLRRKLEKSSHQYDQARERFLSLKKDAKPETVQDSEGELQAAKINYEQTRFTFAQAVSSIEYKKKFEYVESVASTLDSHLRYFKQGYDLLSELEPYIQQVLAFSQQAREAGLQEQASLNAQVEDYLQAQQKEHEGAQGPDVNGMLAQGPFQPVGGSSQKEIEELMAASTLKGKVQVIRQGYLLKRSSNLRGDWQRRFFVLDSRGMLYYYRKGSVLSFKHSGSTPLNSPPTAGLVGHPLGTGLQAAANPAQSFFQSSMQGVSNLILTVRTGNSGTTNTTTNLGGLGVAPDSPTSPSPSDSAPLTPCTSSTSSSAPVPPQHTTPFSMFSRVLNTKRESMTSNMPSMPWRGFGAPSSGAPSGAASAAGAGAYSAAGGAGAPSVAGGGGTVTVSAADADSSSGAAGSAAVSAADAPTSTSSMPLAAASAAEGVFDALARDDPKSFGGVPSAELLSEANSSILLTEGDSVSSTPQGSPPRDNSGPLQMPTGMQEWNTGKHDCQAVNLLTATLKMDAEQSDLRFCFRIVTPSKTFTLQAENAAERKDWVDKITAVIASLLNAQFLGGPSSGPHGLGLGGVGTGSLVAVGRPIDVLQAVTGNGVCVDCGKAGPDWASLNLGVLMCIECSGIHRNLGVQVSKVRSLTLDVRVWEELPVLAFFRATGNSFANSMWEEGLKLTQTEAEARGLEQSETDTEAKQQDGDDVNNNNDNNNMEEGEGVKLPPHDASILAKPQPQDPLQLKEKFIFSKYLERKFLAQPPEGSDPEQAARALWIAVEFGNIQKAMRLLVCSRADPNVRREAALGEAPEDGEESKESRSRFKDQAGRLRSATLPVKRLESKEEEQRTEDRFMAPERESGDGGSQPVSPSQSLKKVHSEVLPSESGGLNDDAEGSKTRGATPGPEDAVPRTPGGTSRRSIFAVKLKKTFVRSATDVMGSPGPRAPRIVKQGSGLWGGGSKSEEHVDLSGAAPGNNLIKSSEGAAIQLAPTAAVAAAAAGAGVAANGSFAPLTERGWTLLHLACSRDDLGSVEMLLQHGAQLDAQDGEGRTPLHCALLMGHMVCAKHLVTRGADPHIKDNGGLTPLQSCLQRGGHVADPSLLVQLS